MKKYNVVIATEIGTFIINKNDLGVGWQLSEYGTYDPQELQLVRNLMSVLRGVRPNLVAIDIGANIGIHSVILSKEVGLRGKVFAFEAQRIIFNMLAGNVALNSLSNVHCYHHAVSDSAGSINIPQFDYGKPMSFGSVEFGGQQIENIGQNPLNDIENQEIVSTIAIDDLGFNQLDFMKIDVEGMELNVLQGAEKTIAKFMPLMLLEYLKSDKNLLINWLTHAGYDIYAGIGANYLCIPQTFELKIEGMTKVGLS